MQVQSFVCPTCGAPKGILPESRVVYCDHCGGLVAFDTSRQAWGIAAPLRAGQRAAAADEARARRRRLEAEMEVAQREGDRAAYRARLSEAYALDLLTDPVAMGPAPGNADRTRRWMRASLAMRETLAFDPQAEERFAAVTQAQSALCEPRRRDFIELGRRALAAWREYYAWAASCLGEDAEVLNVDALAHSAFRQSLGPAAIYLGEGAVARVRHEVLGDSLTAACPTCGAPLEGESVTACRYCGALRRVEVDDPWITGLLTLWQPNLETLTGAGKLDDLEAPMSALQVALFSATTGIGTVTPEALLRALRRLVPWVYKSRLVEAIVLLQASAGAPVKETLVGTRMLVDQSWKVDRSARPPS